MFAFNSGRLGLSRAGFTCPDLDQLALTLRAHVPDPELTRALIRVERVRLANVQLRAAASGPLSKTRAASVRVETSRIEDRILAMAARVEDRDAAMAAVRTR